MQHHTSSKITSLHQPCPSCPSSDAYCEYDDGHGFCFSCNYYKPGNTREEVTQEEFTYEYLPTRGITRETLRHYDIKTKIDKVGKPKSTGFIYPNGATKVRDYGDKKFRWSGDSNPGLFGLDRFTPGAHKCITITEGEYDAASIYQVTRSPAVSVRSAASASNDCAAARSALNSYERIYLAFDNDAAGREAATSVARLFDFNKVYNINFGHRKDANEFLQHGEGDDLLNLWHNSKKYLPSSIINSFDEFKRVLTEPNKTGIPYPFPTLTKMTYGIRTGETVLIKAQEKVGKTTLMHALEYNILKRTQDNVGSIFIEEPKLRHLQSLAGIELKKPVHLPDCGVTEDEVISAVKRAVGADERLHVYSHFGSDDPDILLDTIRFLVSARQCKYILFDHITMAVSGLAGDAERRALEYLASRLEMMVKELDFSLIMVSHVNDVGQTRGSHYLTKVADITIDARRDTLAADPIEKRTIHLSIPYNRFCSSTGFAGSLLFDEDSYTLREIGPWPTSSLDDLDTTVTALDMQ